MEQYYYLHVIIQYLGEGGMSLAVAWKHSPTHSMESHTEYRPSTEEISHFGCEWQGQQ